MRSGVSLRPYRRLRRPAGTLRLDARRLLQKLQCVLLAMALDIQGCDLEQVRVIPEQPQPVVAPLAQQPTHPAGDVIVIQMLR